MNISWESIVTDILAYIEPYMVQTAILRVDDFLMNTNVPYRKLIIERAFIQLMDQGFLKHPVSTGYVLTAPDNESIVPRALPTIQEDIPILEEQPPFEKVLHSKSYLRRARKHNK